MVADPDEVIWCATFDRFLIESGRSTNDPPGFRVTDWASFLADRAVQAERRDQQVRSARG